MKGSMIAMFMVLASVMSNAQALPASSVSDKYPLMAHITQVQVQHQQYDGGTYDWHLMTAEINGRTYSLDAQEMFFSHEKWLKIGDYPCRQTKKGFEFEYHDENGKLRHDEFVISSEE